MLSYGLGLIISAPNLVPSQEKVKNTVIYPKGILLEVSQGDCMSWMLLQTPVFPVWEKPPNFQMPTSLHTACWKYRAQNNIFYQPEHSQLHPFYPKHSHFRSKLGVKQHTDQVIQKSCVIIY